MQQKEEGSETPILFFLKLGETPWKSPLKVYQKRGTHKKEEEEEILILSIPLVGRGEES